MRISRTIFGRKTSWLGWVPKFQHRVRTRYLDRRAMAVPMKEGILCRILGIFRFYADPDDRDISPHLIMEGFWEPRVTEAIVDRLRPGMVAIDVGANLGYFSVLMASLVGRGGHVLAFEPNPPVANLLMRSMSINGFSDRVTLHQAPLGQENGLELVLHVQEHHPGGTQRTHGPAQSESDLVTKMIRLDSVPRALEATLVKIDTEGMEENVWRGMSGIIAGARLRFVLLEFSGNCYADNGAKLIDEAVAAGFALKRLDDRRGVVATRRAEILARPTEQMMLLFER